MDKLINSIINKDFKDAESSLREELASLVEKKLYEKKKMMVAGETPFKTEVERTGSVRAKRKPLKGVTKVLKDIKEQIVQKDGLVHLATGEKVLPSVYRQRRWLAEGAEGKGEFADDIRDHLDHKDPEVRKHAKQAMDALDDNEVEEAQEHLEQAKKLAKQLKEDCGLAPELEAKVEAARERAKMLLEPRLDTTAPTVDRTKLTIPKGKRPADRLTAPDLGPKEDEWMHGKKLDEAKKASKAAYAKFWAHDPEQGEKIKKFGKEEKAFAGAKKEIIKLKKKNLEEELLDEMARKVSDAATKAFLEKKTFKSKNTKSTGDELHLHGNKIAYHKDGKIHATMAGWPTTTTKERLNSLSSAVGGKRFHTKGGKHYYGDKEITSDEHVELN